MKLLSIILLLCFVQATISTLSTSPLFMWSNSNDFETKNGQVDEPLSSSEVVDALRRFSGVPAQGKNELFVSTDSKPEVVLFFLAPQTSNIGVLSGAYSQNVPCTLPFLKENIQSETGSSVVAQYVSMDSLKFKTSLRTFFNQLSEEQTVLATGPNAASLFFTVQHQNKKLIALEGLEQEPIFQNGVTDFVFVVLPSVENPSVVDTIEVVRRSTSHFVTILAFETVTEQSRLSKYYEQGQTSFQHRGAHFFARDSSDDDDSYWPPEILEAVIMAIIYAPILLIGICCTCTMKSPDRYEGGTFKNERQH